MVFSSAVFLFAYLPLVLLGYYLLPRKYQLYFLFVVNLVFYGWGEPVYVALMVFSILLNYVSALLIGKFPSRKKTTLVLCVIANLALLGYFKYTGFFMQNLKALIPALSAVQIPKIVLPIGISFYTFQSMSYVIDVYRQDVPVQKNPVLFGTYVSLFPQLIAGPIVRYQEVEAELKERTISIEEIDAGLKLFIVGLSKKLLLANPMGQMWSALQGSALQNGIVGSWVGIIAYTFQIYFDFSGYSDMAIGLGRMLGFHFLRNFHYPYISKSITDFWRRWHISLSTWFREYIYIPLGGNRRGLPRQILNIAIVWFLTGLWHGASWNFVLWGLYFAILLVIEKLFLLKWLKKAPTWIGHVYSLFFIVLGWALFYFEDASALFTYLRSLFTVGASGVMSPYALNQTVSYLPMLLLCTVSSTPLLKNVWEKVPQQKRVIWESVAAALLLVLCVAAVTSQTYNPFIYFRF